MVRIFLLNAFIALLPSVALACAVCGGGNEENRQAFVFTTILLTLIPLILIGFTVRWIQKRSAERDAQFESQEPGAR